MRRRIAGISAALLALLIPLSIVLANPKASTGPDEYVIAPGDTLWQIAMENDITLQVLLDANPEINPYALSVGAVVRIPMDAALLKDPHDREPNQNEYTIQAGDDLWGLSMRFDLSIEQLLAANPNVDPYALTVGENVVIPGVTFNEQSNEPALPEQTLEYVVQAGDDLWSIARRHNTSYVTLLALNEGIDPYTLQVGQIVMLPSEGSTVETVETSPADNSVPVAPLGEGETSTSPLSADEIAASLGQFLETTNAGNTTLLPLPEAAGQLDIELSPTTEAVTESPATTLLQAVEEEPVVVEPIISPENLTSNIVPININIPQNLVIQNASLTVNGTQLAFYTQAPYSYELDMTAMAAGAYNLTFTTTTTSNVTSTGTMQFNVAYIETTQETVEDPKLNSAAGLLQLEASAPRQMLIDGSEQNALNLTFTPEGGLALISETPSIAQVSQSEDLVSILTSPASLIPAPIRELITAPHPTEAAIIILIMTFTLVPQGLFTLYHMMYTWNNPKMAEKYSSPKEFTAPHHSFTAIIPARHEADVIRQTILAVDRINYPDELKEVLVMVRDEDDDETIEAVQRTIEELGKENIHLITFKDGPRNKPNGLNKGLRVATKDVICVFDAEDEPHEDIYNVINTVMLRDDVDVVQSGVQLMNFQSNWFAAFNCLEYFFWFKSGLHCFTHEFRVTPLGGNTVFFKKMWLDRVGGWDLKCLTEDADIGIRLTQAGAKIQIVYDERHATQEETPANVDSFIKQRTRWCQGFYQVFFKGDWVRLPEMRQRITAVYILLNSLMQAATILYLPIGIFIALTQQIAVPIALLSYIPIFILVIQLVTSLIGIREFTEAYNLKLPFLFRFKMLIAYYPYQLIMAAASVRAVFRFLGQQQAWEKTAHSNLHRQTSPVAR